MKTVSSSRKNNSLKNPIKQNSFRIKFGGKYYEIPKSCVAYIYKKEGVCFIANKDNGKYPIFLDDPNELFLGLNSNQFFKLNESTIFCRNFVRLVESTNQCIAIAFNEAYEDSFIIPREIEPLFKKWISDSNN